MRYYWYPREGAQLFTLASYALETNRRFTFRYEDPKFFLDWLYFKLDYTHLREGSYRFFGLGPRSRPEDESNYSLFDNRLQVLTGVNFLEKMRFIVGHRFRFSDVIDGPVTSLPQISRFTPLPRGVGEPWSIMTQQFSLSYDSRDLPMAPLKGHFFSVYGELAGRIGGDTQYERWGTELKGFYPLRNKRFVTGWRALFDGENGGEDVPFYERSL